MCSSPSIPFTGDPAPPSQAGQQSHGLGCMRDHEGRPDPPAADASTPGKVCCRSEDTEQPHGAEKQHPMVSLGSVVTIIPALQVTRSSSPVLLCFPEHLPGIFHCSHAVGRVRGRRGLRFRGWTLCSDLLSQLPAPPPMSLSCQTSHFTPVTPAPASNPFCGGAVGQLRVTLWLGEVTQGL